MKNFYKVLLAVILLPSLSLAQSNYKPGYVVTLKGDTLRGFVDYREWDKNPDAISFKTALTDTKARQFTPDQARFIKINGQEAYQHYAGPISMDVTDKDHLGYQRDTSSRVASVFFRVLQKGKNLSLYSYTDNLKSRFYVGEAPDYRPKELGYRIYYNYGAETANQQKGATVNENTYMKQLFALANKYEVLNSSLQSDIERSNYNSDNLLEIVSKINHISKEETRKAEALKGPASDFFVGAGLNINNITTNPLSPYHAAGGTGSTSYLPAAFVGMNFFANRTTRQLQFRIELSAAQSQFKSLYQSKVFPYVPFKASFDELAFALTPQVIYNFYNGENLKIFGGAGISLNYFKFSNPYLGSQSQPNSASDVEENNPYYFNKLDDCFVLDAGVQFSKNWTLEAKYIGPVYTNKGGYFQLSSVCEQIQLNYSFK